MPKWPFGSQKVKVECATKLRTTFAASCPTQWAKRCPPPPPPPTGHNSTTNTAQKLNPVPGRVQARPGTASLLASVYTLYTLARTLLVIPANKTFITIGYSGNVGHVGLLPTDRNANARDKQVEHFVRQRRPRLNQVASAVPLSVCPTVCLSVSVRLPTYERSRVPKQATALQLCQNFLAWPKSANKKGAKAAAEHAVVR